jgi:hypothetical protein
MVKGKTTLVAAVALAMTIFPYFSSGSISRWPRRWSRGRRAIQGPPVCGAPGLRRARSSGRFAAAQSFWTIRWWPDCDSALVVCKGVCRVRNWGGTDRQGLVKAQA